MKSWLCCIVLVAVAVFTTACSDSTSTTGSGGAGGSGGTGGAGGTGGSGGADAGCPKAGGGTPQTVACVTVYADDKITFSGSSAPAYTCTAGKSTLCPDGPNACRNDSDCNIINTGLVRDLVRVCALSCRDKEPDCVAEADCNTACVKDATATKIMQPGISADCGKCYTDIALCSISFCLGDCAASADDIACVKCQFANGCRVPFERCSGLDRQ